VRSDVQPFAGIRVAAMERFELLSRLAAETAAEAQTASNQVCVRRQAEAVLRRQDPLDSVERLLW